MNRYATRMPKRVDVTAVAKRKAVKINQTVGLAYPENTCVTATVLVRASTVNATTAVTPIGTGCATSEITVAVKTASRCRCGADNAGNGRRYRSTPGTST